MFRRVSGLMLTSLTSYQNCLLRDSRKTGSLTLLESMVHVFEDRYNMNPLSSATIDNHATVIVVLGVGAQFLAAGDGELNLVFELRLCSISLTILITVCFGCFRRPLVKFRGPVTR